MIVGMSLIITSDDLIEEYDAYVIQKRIENHMFNWDKFIDWWHVQARR